jgi:signal transduction histidine kinase
MLKRVLPEKENFTTLAYLRILIFYKSLIYILPFAFLVLIPGIYYSIKTGENYVAIFDIITYITIVSLIFINRISITIKKLIFTVMMFHLSFQLFFRLDNITVGMLYWLISNISIALLYSKRTTLFFGVFNFILSVIIGLLIAFGNFHIISKSNDELTEWVVTSLNMQFLNIIISILIDYILIKLQHVIFIQNETHKNLENSVLLLQNKNDELEHMTYVASHDLQEPLRMVTSFLAQLDKKYKDQLDQRGKQYIHFAMDGANKMRDVMLEVLAFSKIGMNQSKQEEVNINELVDEVLWMNRKLIQENNSQLIIDQLPIIYGHRILLRTLFTNLISNAVKYKSHARISIIKVEYHEENDMHVFEITDNGIGIPAEKLEQIFLLFNRGDYKNNQVQGSGIGLTICKKIILLMKGNIHVESTLHEGSTFRLKFPKENVK